MCFMFYLKHVVHHICVFEAIFSPDKKNICMKTHNPLYLTSIFHRWPSSGNQNKTMWSLPYCSYHSSGQSIPESKMHVQKQVFQSLQIYFIP